NVLIPKLRELGYDGLEFWDDGHLTYSAFDPEQIKEVTNLNPTANEDIRYSLRGSKTSPKQSAIVNRLPFVSTAEDGVVKRSDIEDFLRKELDIPIAYGKFRERAWGIFKIKPEVIRLKRAKMIPTLFHETGHFLDKRLEISSTADPNVRSELFNLGQPKSGPNYTEEQIIKEGVAEFTKFFILDEQRVTNNLPNTYKMFSDIMAQDMNLDHMMETLRTAIENYRGMTSEQLIESNISRNDVTVKRKLTLDRIYTAMFDEFNPLKRSVESITGNMDLTVEENPFLLATLNRSWQGLADTYLKKGIVDDEYKKIGKSFEEILAPVTDKKELEHYMIARRGLELGMRNITTGNEMLALEDVYNKLHSKYDAVFNDLLEYQDAILQQLVKQGVVSKESYKSIKALNQDYVPMYRVVESFTKQGTGKGFQTRDPLKGIRGSEKDNIAPLESILKNTYLLTAIAERNRVAKAFANLTDKFDGTGKYLEKIPTPMRGQSFSIGEIKDVLLDVGIDEQTLESIDMDVLATVFRPTEYGKKDNVIIIHRDGKKEFFQVHDEDLYRALTAMDKQQMNVFLKMLAFPAKVLRAGAVLNPDFMARNPTRDMMSAMLFARFGFIPAVDTIRGLFHVLKKDDLYYKAMASGALQSSYVSMDRDYLQKNLNALYAENFKDKAMNIIANPLDLLRALSEYSEEATRLGVFGKSVEKYGDTREGIQRAALDARDTTIDFGRGGWVSKSVNPFIAFFNVGLQGLDKTVREFKRDPVGMTLKSVAYISIPSILLFMRNKDDPRYEELEDWEKDLFWIIMTKDKIFRIPKPFVLGIPFGSAVERALEYVYKEDKDAFKGLGESLISENVPNFLPTALIPWIESMTNYSFFRQYEIVPDSQKGWAPWAQYSEYTTETAKAIGKIMNVSPRIIENTIFGYGAGLAKYGLDITDIVLEAANLVEEKVIPKTQIEDLPIIKGFMFTAYRNASSISDLYDLREELTQKVTTPGVVVDPQDKAELSRVSKVTSQISEIRKKINLVYGSPTYTPEKQKELIDQYTIQMTNIARQALGKKPITE
ncbi:MAG: LPD38 domain-containing protein, partial [Methanolobus sp.]|nr:LPD38 domain-containing protein [Methanolobus sp.]